MRGWLAALGTGLLTIMMIGATMAQDGVARLPLIPFGVTAEFGVERNPTGLAIRLLAALHDRLE